ncbi:MAG: rhodanese-like domain-containing protein [Methanomassiliicoccus sp.]|nr:rhodanese-like domain-containing protein [Methanomassiliicoccus sp.]
MSILMSTVTFLSQGQLKGLEAAIRDGCCSLLDVREKHEFEAGHIPLATNRPLSEVTRWQAGLDKVRPVVLYCRTTNRSRRCAEVLCAQGFREIYVLDGGYAAWASHDPSRS